MLIGDGHDDADRDEEEPGDGQGEQDAVPRQVNRITFHHVDTNHEHED